MTNPKERHHYKQSLEYPNECMCGLKAENPLHIQPKQPKPNAKSQNLVRYMDNIFIDNYCEFTDQGVLISYVGKNGIDLDDFIGSEIEKAYKIGVESGKKNELKQIK